MIGIITAVAFAFIFGGMGYQVYLDFKFRKKCPHKDKMTFTYFGGHGIVQCMDCDQILER